MENNKDVFYFIRDWLYEYIGANVSDCHKYHFNIKGKNKYLYIAHGTYPDTAWEFVETRVKKYKKYPKWKKDLILSAGRIYMYKNDAVIDSEGRYSVYGDNMKQDNFILQFEEDYAREFIKERDKLLKFLSVFYGFEDIENKITWNNFDKICDADKSHIEEKLDKAMNRFEMKCDCCGDTFVYKTIYSYTDVFYPIMKINYFCDKEECKEAENLERYKYFRKIFGGINNG